MCDVGFVFTATNTSHFNALMSTTLTHKVILPKNSPKKKHPTILFLHGRGADENDLLSLAEYFGDTFLYIAVRAPFKFEYGWFTWYEILEAGTPDEKMFPQSYNLLSDFFDEMKKEFPIDEKKIFLFGFSMGTVMSYALALTRPHEIAGVIANSGYIAEETHLNYEWEKINCNELSRPFPTFFVAHGIDDPLIPVAFGRRAQQLLEQHNAKVYYKEYPMAHQISEESLEDIVRWINERI